MNYATELNFDELTNEGLVLVDFYADWCGPCKMIAPVLEEIDKEDADLNIVKVDVDAQGVLAQRYGVMSIPTLVLFKDGVKVDEMVGFAPKPNLVQFYSKHK
ncbi:MAG TPA: thioredoxin [Erysipelothrix sp.]|jgi:thioredoxin 1|nr:thioredoxin [Erysipelothrix sp.]